MTTRNELAELRDAQKLTLSNRAYDVAKDSATIYLPALAVAYGALAQFWPLPFVPQVIGTIGVLVVFLGSVLKKSNKDYQKVVAIEQSIAEADAEATRQAELAEAEEAKAKRVVGELYVVDTDEGQDTGMVNVAFNEDLKTFAGRDEITLEVKRVQLPPQ